VTIGYNPTLAWGDGAAEEALCDEPERAVGRADPRGAEAAVASPAEPRRSGHVEEYGSLDLLPLLCTPAGISRREAEAVPECPRLAPAESVIT
jgi:hypothetical protein